MKKLKILLLTFSLTLPTMFETAYASDNSQLKPSTEFQKIIDEYKTYVATVVPEVRDEVINYRKEIAKLNKQKKLLYKTLSQNSQEYLKKEQEYKKKLPMARKSLINMETPGQKPNFTSQENKSVN